MHLKTTLFLMTSLFVAGALSACGGNGGGQNNPRPDAMVNTADADPLSVIIEFPDPNLEACVREAINRPTGDVKAINVRNLTFLECEDMYIVSAEGLQHFISLKHLSLWENELIDVAPLSNLKELETLQLGNNQISDLTPLRSLTRLKRLGLAVNIIADVAPITDASDIEYLNLDNNQIADTSPLISLRHLTWLTIESNPITDNSGVVAAANRGAETYKRRGPVELSRVVYNPLKDIRPVSESEARRGTLSYTSGRDGTVHLTVTVGDRTYPVQKGYAGEILLTGDRFVHKLQGHHVLIGQLKGDRVELCQGEYADVCDLAIGRKDPSSATTAPGFEHLTAPVFNATLTFGQGRALTTFPVDGVHKDGDEGDPTASDTGLIDYAFASPNQYDAGSCLFMANTGCMEILLNQHTPQAQMEYQGITDLSERYLMSASDLVPGAQMGYTITNVLYTYNFHGGALLNRDYPFTVGYVKDQGGNIVLSDASDPDAYLSCYVNWFSDLPGGWQDMLVETPEADRTIIFVDPDLDDSSIWNVGIIGPDVIERIKYELKTKNAPVVVVYNHYLYWHSNVIMGYNDEVFSNGCPFVNSTLSYFRQQGATSYADKIEAHLDAVGGCSDYGVFFVRDSIYDGTGVEPDYTYSTSPLVTDKYSRKMTQLSYNWAVALGNHAYTVHRK